MTELEAAKNLARAADMLALCLQHEPSRIEMARREVEMAYRIYAYAAQDATQDR